MIVSHSCVDYKNENGSPNIYIFGRTPDDPKTRQIVKVSGFNPYFFIRDELTAKIEHDPRVQNMWKDPAIPNDLLGNPVTRVETYTPSQVRELRDEYFVDGDTYQADVLFDRNFLYNAGIRGGLELNNFRMFNGHCLARYGDISPAESPVLLRKLYCDIETAYRGGNSATIHDPKDPLTCVSFFDSFNQQLYTLQWHPKTKKRRKVDRTYPFVNGTKYPWELHFFPSEKRMLSYAFHLMTNAFDFDVFLAWNAPFDIGYLINRSKTVGLDPRVLSPVPGGNVFVTRNGEPVVEGRVIFDLYEAYYRLTIVQGKRKSYRLGFIGNLELGYGKTDWRNQASYLGDLWENYPKSHILYNARDVELIVDLDEKMGITDNFNQYRIEFGTEFDDVLKSSRVVDADWIRSAIGKGMCLPTKPAYNKDRVKDKKKFAGGFVFRATPGLKFAVIQLDLKTLYLNIIDILNASPESIVGFWKDIKQGPDDKPANHNIIWAANGLCFRLGNDSFSRECVRRYKKNRQEMKDAMVESYERGDKVMGNYWNGRQKAYKSVTLSYYGVQGYRGSRLYNKDMAEAITLTGQYIIKFTAAVVESPALRSAIKKKFGLDCKLSVIYGDTDSVFVEGLPMDKSVICDIADFIGEYISQKYSLLQQKFNSDVQPLKIRSETIYKSFYQTYTKGGKDRKKTYTGEKWFELQETAKGDYWKEVHDKIEIKGFEEKKANTPKFAKDAHKGILRAISFDCYDKGKGFTRMRKFLMGIEKRYKTLIRDRKFEDIAVPTRIASPLHNYFRKKKDGSYEELPKHIKGIVWLNESIGTEYGVGESVMWIYVEKVPDNLPPTDVVSFVYPYELEGLKIKYDWEKMYRLNVVNKVNQILAGMGVTYHEIISGKFQRSVTDYWN